MAYRIEPATPERWGDLAELFGPSGAYAGCWCMWNRQTSREYEERKGDENRRALEALVASGEVPGLLAYAAEQPVGWVSLGPRSVFSRLDRSRVTKPLDDREAWAVTCFVIDRQHRGQGVATALLAGAVEYAREQGATLLEGYPVEPREGAMPDIYAWMGLATMFEAAGFAEVARRSETRPFMRLEL